MTPPASSPAQAAKMKMASLPAGKEEQPDRTKETGGEAQCVSRGGRVEGGRYAALAGCRSRADKGAGAAAQAGFGCVT